MRVEGAAETGTAANEPPLSGRIVVKDAGDLDVSIPSGLGHDGGGGTRYLQLRRATVELVERAHPSVVVSSTNTGLTGWFQFSGDQLGGRALADLSLVVHAGAPSVVEVKYGVTDGRVDATLAVWTFRVDSGPAPTSGGHRQLELGEGMWIEVPEWEEDHPLVQPYESSGRPVPYSGHDSSDQPISGWRAFFACALLTEQRVWYHGAYLADRLEDDPPPPGIPAVTVVYPGKPSGSCYAPLSGLIYLGLDVGASALAHEFGHALTKATAERQPNPFGLVHYFEGRAVDTSSNPDLREVHLQQLDFWEGYASFIGQVFLEDSIYAMNADSAYDLESPSGAGDCALGYGDWCSASYLWDLVDPARTHAAGRRRSGATSGGDDDVALSFGEVHALYRAYSEERGANRHSLADFHDYLCRARSDLATQLAAILQANHLDARRTEWHRLVAAHVSMT